MKNKVKILMLGAIFFSVLAITLLSVSAVEAKTQIPKTPHSTLNVKNSVDTPHNMVVIGKWSLRNKLLGKLAGLLKSLIRYIKENGPSEGIGAI